jgi:hypothetical protein
MAIAAGASAALQLRMKRIFGGGLGKFSSAPARMYL